MADELTDLRARLLEAFAFDEQRLFAVGASRVFTSEAGIPADHAYTQMCEHAALATLECVLNERLKPLLEAVADCVGAASDTLNAESYEADNYAAEALTKAIMRLEQLLEKIAGGGEL